MDDIPVRKGKREDARAFSQLILLSAPTFLPYLFGPDVRNVMHRLFHHIRNYFSFEHSYFVEVDGEIAGMALIYNYEQKKKKIYVPASWFRNILEQVFSNDSLIY